jgi:TonB-linked SusC/RagA family outer membrane protein
MKKLILFIAGFVCAMHSLKAQQTVSNAITGRVVSASDETAVAGASLVLKTSGTNAITDAKGNFSLVQTIAPDTLTVSHIGFHKKQIVIQNSPAKTIIIKLEPSNTQLHAVTVSTGYQQIPKERATGSFDFIDNKLLNRSVSPDILSRLKGVTSGLLFDDHIGNNLGISIRGRSTIFANTQPLIVLNNFPYDGNLNDINPNDVENITILKDAAASSIWGARAGNGVIVITTKNGKYNQPVSVSINSNVTIANKPDLFSLPLMNSSDYIDVEEFLFNKGYYNSTINSTRRYALSPVVDLLNKEQTGQLSTADVTDQISALKSIDLRHDMLKYLYQDAVNQQYAVNLSGGGTNQLYYLSFGYDNDLNSLVGDQNKRYTIDANSTYALLNHKLEITAGIDFEQSLTSQNGLSPATLTFGNYTSLYPYARLADAKGNSLTIPKYNQEYIDTVGSGKLLDWNYRPLDELKYSDRTSTANDYRITLGIKYKMFKGMNIIVKYLYQKDESDSRNLHNQQSFYTRDYINQFSEVNWQNGQVTYPVPLGAILDLGNTATVTQNLRGQINYITKWNNKNELTFIAGSEISNAATNGNSFRFYGYDPTHGTNVPVDYYNTFPNYITGYNATIINEQGSVGLINRDISVFSNAVYTYHNRYAISASARKDASNLFGVNANQKWVPLWSIGASWLLNQEPFYHISWLPYLKFRITYGYSGNVDKTVTALLTTQIVYHNIYGVPNAQLVNPPNPDLQWERISQMNFAVDYAAINNRITGSLEYYKKKGTDLIGYAPLAPSSGLTSYKGNTSDMKGEGIDITVHSVNIDRAFKWNTTVLINYARNWVTKYKIKSSTINTYISNALGNPLVGKPVDAVYSFKWAGLVHNTGAPMGYMGGKTTVDYAALYNSTDFNDMHYSGPSVPTYFGSIRNSFSWEQFTLSFNILYKLGYYFRRNSINYGDLFYRNSEGNSDYAIRWQKPGDETKTNIPSMVYPDDPYRDYFYQYSAILIDKGAQIRLQDIRLNYELSQRQFHSLPISSLNFYLYANNLGILWKANKEGIDPDYNPNRYYNIPTPKSLSIGLKVNFK